ncbi:MAG: bifunctional glycosyltransferase family 2/GtrA family protein [Clostridiales bacterium]|nr:bifunctional glycosyltransferase family 2/GtrA family protein [Clostridiales bacterium]
MNKEIKYAVVIPAYNPDEKFVSFIEILRKNGIFVIVIDDGSKAECSSYFTAAEQYGCVVLHHDRNRGKGQALRTGFAELIRLNEKGAGLEYAVTADCDGQHRYDAITAVVQAAADSTESPAGPALIIGGRFRDSDEKVPLKSKIGNNFTRGLFKLVTGISIHDTQTGLRAVPAKLFEEMLLIKGDRYEYEMNMLLLIRSWGIPYREIPITTIYYNNNAGSHFHPFRDSFLVISQILKFACSSLISFLVDYVLFMILELYFDYAPAYAIARLTSGMLNYILNAKVVFGKMTKMTFLKYFVVWGLILAAGSLGGMVIKDVLHLPNLVCKIFVDLPLFCVSYFVQKHFVFKK